MRVLFISLLGISSAVAAPLAAQETRETIAGWTLEERRNPSEPRDYSVMISRRDGAVEVVAKRGTVRGRSAMLRIDNCSDISFGNSASGTTLAEQVQAIRESVASSYADSRTECRLPPFPATLLSGMDEAYRAADAKFRVGRPPQPQLDKRETAGGWTIEDRRDDSDAGDPGKRLVSITRVADGLKLTESISIDLFFHDLFFTEHKIVAEYADCRREAPLEKLGETGGAAETAAQRKAILAALAGLEQDCQMPKAASLALLSDFAPAFGAMAAWTRQHVANRAALIAASEEYEARLADAEYAARTPDGADGAMVEGAADAMEAAAAAAAAADEPSVPMTSTRDKGRKRGN